MLFFKSFIILIYFQLCNGYFQFKKNYNNIYISNSYNNDDDNSLQGGLIPTKYPTFIPSTSPSFNPSSIPSSLPSSIPSLEPTFTPSISPTFNPSNIPTLSPSFIPSSSPTIIPSISPTFSPSTSPTIIPSVNPTTNPSVSPSFIPSNNPSFLPSSSPSYIPSISPSFLPSTFPSTNPTFSPSNNPSFSPSFSPSFNPSSSPTFTPSSSPLFNPSSTPSFSPSTSPSSSPSISPTIIPSNNPTTNPSVSPSFIPSNNPSFLPSSSPSYIPSISPSFSPSSSPTFLPSSSPTFSPSTSPSTTPSITPSSSQPTFIPSNNPSFIPTIFPTKNPTLLPSQIPSIQPTLLPSLFPTRSPTSQSPTQSLSYNDDDDDQSTHQTRIPTKLPTLIPTLKPTNLPSISPSFSPTSLPTLQPSLNTIIQPTSSPTFLPISLPTLIPSLQPSLNSSISTLGNNKLNQLNTVIISLSALVWIIIIIPFIMYFWNFSTFNQKRLFKGSVGPSMDLRQEPQLFSKQSVSRILSTMLTLNDILPIAYHQGSYYNLFIQEYLRLCRWIPIFHTSSSQGENIIHQIELIYRPISLFSRIITTSTIICIIYYIFIHYLLTLCNNISNQKTCENTQLNYISNHNICQWNSSCDVSKHLNHHSFILIIFFCILSGIISLPFIFIHDSILLLILSKENSVSCINEISSINQFNNNNNQHNNNQHNNNKVKLTKLSSNEWDDIEKNIPSSLPLTSKNNTNSSRFSSLTSENLNKLNPILTRKASKIQQNNNSPKNRESELHTLRDVIKSLVTYRFYLSNDTSILNLFDMIWEFNDVTKKENINENKNIFDSDNKKENITNEAVYTRNWSLRVLGYINELNQTYQDHIKIFPYLSLKTKKYELMKLFIKDLLPNYYFDILYFQNYSTRNSYLTPTNMRRIFGTLFYILFHIIYCIIILYIFCYWIYSRILLSWSLCFLFWFLIDLLLISSIEILCFSFLFRYSISDSIIYLRHLIQDLLIKFPDILYKKYSNCDSTYLIPSKQQIQSNYYEIPYLLYQSLQIAKFYPNLPESMFIQSFQSILPSEYLRTKYLSTLSFPYISNLSLNKSNGFIPTISSNSLIKKYILIFILYISQLHYIIQVFLINLLIWLFIVILTYLHFQFYIVYPIFILIPLFCLLNILLLCYGKTHHINSKNSINSEITSSNINSIYLKHIIVEKEKYDEKFPSIENCDSLDNNDQSYVNHKISFHINSNYNNSYDNEDVNNENNYLRNSTKLKKNINYSNDYYEEILQPTSTNSFNKDYDYSKNQTYVPDVDITMLSSIKDNNNNNHDNNNDQVLLALIKSESCESKLPSNQYPTIIVHNESSDITNDIILDKKNIEKTTSRNILPPIRIISRTMTGSPITKLPSIEENNNNNNNNKSQKVFTTPKRHYSSVGNFSFNDGDKLNENDRKIQQDEKNNENIITRTTLTSSSKSPIERHLSKAFTFSFDEGNNKNGNNNDNERNSMISQLISKKHTPKAQLSFANSFHFSDSDENKSDNKSQGSENSSNDLSIPPKYQTSLRLYSRNLSEQQDQLQKQEIMKNDENGSHSSSNLSDYEDIFGNYSLEMDDSLFNNDEGEDNNSNEEDDNDNDNDSQLSNYSMNNVTSIIATKSKLMKKLEKMKQKRLNVQQEEEEEEEEENIELSEDEINQRKKLIEAKKRFVMASAMNNTSREYSHLKAQQHMYERLNKRKIQKNKKKTFRKTIPRTTNMKELLDLTENNLQKGGTIKQAIELYSTLNNDEEIIRIKKELEKRLNANKERTRISLNEGEYQAKKRLEKRRKEIRKQYIENNIP